MSHTSRDAGLANALQIAALVIVISTVVIAVSGAGVVRSISCSISGTIAGVTAEGVSSCQGDEAVTQASPDRSTRSNHQLPAREPRGRSGSGGGTFSTRPPLPADPSFGLGGQPTGAPLPLGLQNINAALNQQSAVIADAVDKIDEDQLTDAVRPEGVVDLTKPEIANNHDALAAASTKNAELLIEASRQAIALSEKPGFADRPIDQMTVRFVAASWLDTIDQLKRARWEFTDENADAFPTPEDLQIDFKITEALEAGEKLLEFLPKTGSTGGSSPTPSSGRP